MKFRLAAFRINSIDMKMTMMLRRVSTPATPMVKSSAPMMRNFERSGCSIPCLMLSRTPPCQSASAGVKRLFIVLMREASALGSVRARGRFDLGRERAVAVEARAHALRVLGNLRDARLGGAQARGLGVAARDGPLLFGGG